MLWRAAAGRQANPKIAALYEVSNCNGESGCTIVKDSENKKITCQFGVKWVIPQDDLKTAFIFTHGHHGINFQVTSTALQLDPSMCVRVLELDGLDYGQGGATTATVAMTQAQQ
jgi:hypothetical protein